ncbi:MAG: endoglucanase [Candidatus Hinthialibacteria bacterium]|nr:M42 family metallopeptidase [bacterium]MBK7494113.1 M42 family metallopeptidase [Candidatus Omnitrophota bacterium]MBV6480730.1 putative aminopeptidase YsdC [bacterium]MCC6731884.1 M42 family metallopeptidase [Candidatus Omnitrophota bacterium]
MDKKQIEFFKSLLSAHSPSGYEQDVRKVWREHVCDAADEVLTDVMGNCIAILNPGGTPRVLLAGHCDEIGFQVSHIDDNGYLCFKPIGGHDTSLIPGRRVLVHTQKGPIPGVTGKKAIHLMTEEERKKIPEIHDLWIDIAAGSREEAQELVRIGDCITHDLGYRELRNNLVVSRALDDRTGAYVAAETLLACARRKSKLKACVVAVATVQEEVGLRGAITAAFGTRPDIGICIDVTHATDSPGMDQRKHGVVKLGKGPTLQRGGSVNPHVFDLLAKAAKDHNLPFQPAASPGRVGNDTWSLQVVREGVATGTVGIPLRYMHTPSEVGSLDDLDAAVGILSEFCLSLNAKTKLIPD